MCSLVHPAHTALKITARFSLDEPSGQLFHLPCPNSNFMHCRIFLATYFVIKMRASWKQQQFWHQRSSTKVLFSNILCFLLFCQSHSIYNRKMDKTLLFAMEQVTSNRQCFTQEHKTNHLSVRLAILCLLDLHTSKHHLQQVFYPYWQIPIAASSCHDRTMPTSCFGKNSFDMEQLVYICWYLYSNIWGCFLLFFCFLCQVFLFVWVFLQQLLIREVTNQCLWDNLSMVSERYEQDKDILFKMTMSIVMNTECHVFLQQK